MNEDLRKALDNLALAYEQDDGSEEAGESFDHAVLEVIAAWKN